MTTKLPGIPEPVAEANSLVMAVSALKEHAEVRQGIRGELLDKAVTFRDLVDLGLVTLEAANAQAR